MVGEVTLDGADYLGRADRRSAETSAKDWEGSRGLVRLSLRAEHYTFASGVGR